MRFTKWPRASAIAAVLALVSGSVAGASDASSAAVGSGDERRISHHVLENGLRVSIHSDARMPVVATQVWYHVGSANERPESRGFAHLFEHLMFGGTATYGKEDYARHHQQHGGFENAYTTQDQTVYVSSIAPEFHDKVLEMEADRMVNLRLDAKNLANEKKIVTEELRLTQENNPESRVVAAALKAVLGKHPYSNLPTGTKEDIAAATLDEDGLRASLRRRLPPYMVPREFHALREFPLNANGKVDRNVLRQKLEDQSRGAGS